MLKIKTVSLIICAVIISLTILFALPVSTMAAGLPFSDNFDSGYANNWVTYGGTWSIANGQYTVGASAGSKAIARYTNFYDFILEADVSASTGGNAGLLFRENYPATGTDSYYGYYVGISPNSQQLVLGKAANNWTQIGIASATIAADTMYHIKVVAIGSNIQVFVSDMNTPKINATDSTYIAGSVGVRTCNADAKFDNVTVKEVFGDSFNSGSAGNWTPYGGTWTVANGQYNVDASAGAKATAENTSFSDLAYEADVTLATGGNAGVIFRASNPAVGADAYTGYYVGISLGTQQVIFGKANNNWTQIAVAAVTITANTQYHIKVIAQGTGIKVYVTDMNAPKISAVDSSYVSGTIGVRTYNSSAKFDNIVVTSIAPAAAIQSGAYYVIKPRCANGTEVLEVQDASTADGGNVREWADNGSAACQLWKVDDMGGGYYKLTNFYSGKVLEVAGSGMDTWTNVQQWSDTGGDNQRWRIEGQGDGYFKLTAKHSNLCLNVHGGLASSANVDQSPDNGTSAQRWQFIRISQPVTGTEVKIMPLGDSITKGTGLPNLPVLGGYRLPLWNSILARGKKVNFVGSSHDAYTTALGDNNHEGHPGWRIDQIDTKINTWMDAYQPKIVMLHIGTNDILQNYDVANAPARLSNLINNICAKLPAGGKLYVAKITPLANTDQNQMVNNYNAQIPGIVQSKQSEGKPVYMVDINSVVSVSDLPDGIHPNAKGYGNMAQAWYSAVINDLN